MIFGFVHSQLTGQMLEFLGFCLWCARRKSALPAMSRLTTSICQWLVSKCNAFHQSNLINPMILFCRTRNIHQCGHWIGSGCRFPSHQGESRKWGLNLNICTLLLDCNFLVGLWSADHFGHGCPARCRRFPAHTTESQCGLLLEPHVGESPQDLLRCRVYDREIVPLLGPK